MGSTRGFTHIHLFVRDISRSLRFYQEGLGMVERFREGPRLVFLSTPGHEDLITLNERADDASRPGDSGGVWHFGFLVDAERIDQVIQAAVAAGGTLIERGRRGPRSPFAALSDPDGYAIELYTPES